MRARRLRVLLRRALARRADACLTNSRAGERYLVDVVKAGEGRVLRSHYLVPSLRALGGAVAQPAAPGGLARPVFLYVGRLSRLKGTHLLLESCAILKRRGRSDFSLLLVGDGPERPELRETARTLGLEPFLRWEGWVAYDRLSLYFRLSDVFVFPTLSDVWGMAAIEAMAYSKPVLCSRWAGVSDLVRPGENGFLFDPRSPESLADFMELYMDDRARISPMGIRSRELVAGLTPEAAALRLRDVAWRVCGLGGAPDGEG